MEPTESYDLKCRDCSFTHAIPSRFRDELSEYSVDERDVRIKCVYGGQFTVTLKVKDFFTLERRPAQGRVLMASIALNMKPLHDHLLSHCDPLFLIILQTRRETHHEYKRVAEGRTFVRFSNEQGVDIIGDIDVSKAEIPGVS